MLFYQCQRCYFQYGPAPLCPTCGSTERGIVSDQKELVNGSAKLIRQLKTALAKAFEYLNKCWCELTAKLSNSATERTSDWSTVQLRIKK